MSSKDPRKLAFVAGAQGALVAKNILKHIAGQTLGVKEDGLPPVTKPVGFLALSPKLGVGQLPMGSGMVVGRYASRAIKSKTLFADKAFQEVGLKLPSTAATALL